MTWLDDETSDQDSRPIELYEISYGTTTWHLCSGNRDVLIPGGLYTALSMGRDDLPVSTVGVAGDLIVSLPVNHAIVRRYLQQGIPPRQVLVTVKRLQERSGEVETLRVGRATSLAVDGVVAKLRVPSRTMEALLKTLPTGDGADRSCPYILYDEGTCSVDRDASVGGVAHKVVTTVIHVDGRDVRVDLGAGRGGDWSRLGELVHVPTGERMTIGEQADVGSPSTVADLTLQTQIVGMKVGDTVEIYAGCNKDVATCRAKFDNKVNFGGAPQMPTSNPFIWVTTGIRG